MGKEFTVYKEFSTVSATLVELVAIDKIIKEAIDSAEFREEYVSLISDIHNTYKGVITILDPLVQLLDKPVFEDHFEKVQPWFAASYQPALSAPRVNAEYTYEKFLQFRKVKEFNSSYPPLKAVFSRLFDLIDKWIDNDIWLAMSIDTVLKVLNEVLTDVNRIRVVDQEEAYRYYYSCISGIAPYLSLIKDMIENIDKSLELTDHAEVV